MEIKMGVMNPIIKSPFFWLGILLRLGLIILGLKAATIVNWYAPFMDASVSNFVIDPWSRWLANSGTPLAFPYGYVMWLAFLPLTALTSFLGLGSALGYLLTLIAFDLGLLYTF